MKKLNLVAVNINWYRDCGNSPSVRLCYDPEFVGNWDVIMEDEENIFIVRRSTDGNCVEFRSVVKEPNNKRHAFKGGLGGTFELSDGRVVTSNNVWSSRCGVVNKISGMKLLDVDTKNGHRIGLDTSVVDLVPAGTEEQFYLIWKEKENDICADVSTRYDVYTKQKQYGVTEG